MRLLHRPHKQPRGDSEGPATEDLSIHPSTQLREELDRAVAAGDVPRLLELLGDEHPDIRRDAARALGGLADLRAVEPLTAIVRRGPDEPVPTGSYPGDVGEARAAAAEALGELGDRRAVEPLIAALTGDWAVRDAAAMALVQLDDDRAVEPLVTALRDPVTYSFYGPGVEDAAAWLSTRGDPRVKEALFAGYDEAGDCTHFGAALAALDGDDVRQFFLDRVEREESGVAASMLVQLGDLRVVPPLAARFRAHFAEPGALDGPARTLVRLGEPGVAALLDTLEGERAGGYLREAAADALAAAGDPRADEARNPDAADRTRLATLRATYEAFDYAGASVGQLADLLREQVAWFRAHEADYSAVRPEASVRETQIVAVGRELDRRGGMDLMREVHGQVPQDYQRYVERAWSGIGSWWG